MIEAFQDRVWLLSTAVQENIQILSNDRQRAAFFSSQAARAGLVGSGVYLAVQAFFGYNLLYPATFTGFCFCACIGTHLLQTPQQEVWNQEFRSKILSFLPKAIREYLDNTDKWVEFKSWPSVRIGHVLPPPPADFWISLKRFFSRSPPRQYVYVKIRAFTDGTSLKYEMLNSETQAKNTGSIQIDQPIDEAIERLKKSSVVLEDNGLPVFSQTYHGLYKNIFVNGIQKRYSTVQVELLLRENDLIFNIYDNDDAGAISISTPANSLSKRCSEDTCNFFKSAEKGSLIDRIHLAKECVLSGYERDPPIVYLEPIHQCSHLDQEILVSKFMWAVTLIRNKGPSGNHAEIIIEGINDGFFPEEIVPNGEYFIYLADLLGDMDKGDGSKTKVRFIRTMLKRKINLQYQARSKIWKRSSACVKDMINEIQIEKADPPPGFAKYGRYSVFASKKVVEDSCITWAIAKLASVGVVLEPTTFSFLFTNTSLYTTFNPDQKKGRFNALFEVDQSKVI